MTPKKQSTPNKGHARRGYELAWRSKSAGVIIDAQDRHFWRGGQDFAERMHRLAGILAAELIELVEILHLDLELQGHPAVAAG
jgi:hypothetical protein